MPEEYKRSIRYRALLLWAFKQVVDFSVAFRDIRDVKMLPPFLIPLAACTLPFVAIGSDEVFNKKMLLVKRFYLHASSP